MGLSGSIQGQWGTHDVSQQQKTELQTQDNQKEKREALSHTTQLTQMYHQLNSYHLGTNRAVFFVLPRPHTVQSDLTFVNGPRELEGIQEFFLVVMRPKEVKDICVDAYLETAHVGYVPNYIDIWRPEPSRNFHFSVYGTESTKVFEKTKPYPPTGVLEENIEIDTDNNNGYEVKNKTQFGELAFNVTVASSRKKLSVHGKVKGKVVTTFEKEGNQKVKVKEVKPGFIDANITVFLRRREKVQNGFSQILWLTGRGVCCCEKDSVDSHGSTSKQYDECIVWEEKLGQVTEQEGDLKKGIGDTMSVRDANRMRVEIGRQMLQSINHMNRYDAGAVSF